MKRRYKLKKEPALVLLFIIVLIIILIIFFSGRTVRKLKKIGYTKEEIKVLKTKKASLKLVSKYKYINDITSLVNNSDYDGKNLKKYLDLYKDGYDIEVVIYMVNNDIRYEYSEKLVSLIKHKYFILKNLDRYMGYTKQSSIDLIIRDVNSNVDNEYYTNTKKTDVSKGSLMLVNKYYYLENDYTPKDLVKVDNIYANLNGNMLNSEAYEALKNLINAADNEGYNIRINYSYRDYDAQEAIYNGYKDKKDEAYADSISARPGFSEHQTGYAVDIGVQSKYSNGPFEKSKEYEWMLENSYKYGYILRYPKDKVDVTGYNFEAWHYRYVGVKAATYIHENNITFDEYYAYFVDLEVYYDK